MPFDELEAVRKTAVSEAAEELKSRGFNPDKDGWIGLIDAAEFGRISVRVRLPPRFPDALPEVLVERSTLKRRIPHVEKSGKVCLAPTTGILVDASRPRPLVTWALDRARQVLVDGLSGKNEGDFIEEFLSYWQEGISRTVALTFGPAGAARRVCAARIQGETKGILAHPVLAEDVDAARSWASRFGKKIGETLDAFFVPFTTSLLPPDFDEIVTFERMLEIIEKHSSREDHHAFQDWLEAAVLPAFVVFSLPINVDMGRVVVAVCFEKRAINGFRRDKIKAKREINMSKAQPITRLKVQRLDRSYLLPRGGGVEALGSKKVVLVGCGAIGSHIAQHLASAGVGTVRLIDCDIFEPENVYRHVLEVKYATFPKAMAMKAVLEMRFPATNFEDKAQYVEEVLEKEPDFILGTDLIIVSIGDDTVELRINDILGRRIPRIHAWLEPLGVGGHVLATGVGQNGGCYRCLFEYVDKHGLCNQAAFAAPGQRFQKALAGCSSVFTPFSGLDADRTAATSPVLSCTLMT